MLRNKKIIITWGAGFIGSHLVDKLVELGNEVIVIDNESANSNDSFFWNERAKNYKYDICDYEKIRPLFDKVDYVFHLAAEARIQPTLENPILAAKTNTVGTCTILQCAKEANIKRVIYSSTSSAYGIVNKPPLDEDMLDDCLNPYSVTKVSGEKLCKMYTKLFGLDTIIFRYFNVYGPREPLKGSYAPLVGIFLRQYKAGEPMTIVGDGEQRRDFTHVDDVVQANINAALFLNNPNPASGEVINVGTGTNYSVNDIANMIGGATVNIPARDGEARETLANTTKLQALLGFKPKSRLKDYIDGSK